MRDLNDKTTGNSLTADEWNDIPSEIQNVIEATEQTLSGADLNQLGKGIAQYAGNGDFYTDSGAADIYVLSVTDSKQAPQAYKDGMRCRWRPDNVNTGASTVNVAGLGVKNIFFNGAAVTAGLLPAVKSVMIEYDLANDRFNLLLIDLLASETIPGIAEIATQSETDTGTDDTRFITPLKLTNFPISPSAASVGQAELKTTTAENSTGGVDQDVDLTGGQYAFLLELKTSSTDGGSYGNVTTASATYTTRMRLTDGGVGTTTIRHRYVQASPPYNLGDGNVPLFVYVVIDKTNGKILATSSAPEAPWHHNGPTITKAHHYKKGVGYREMKDMSSIPFTYVEALLDPIKLAEYLTAMKAAKIIYEPITQKIKQADMNLLPTPNIDLFDSNGKKISNTTTVLLDPVSDLMHEIAEMREHSEFSLSDLLHGDYFVIDNKPLKRSGPKGVLIPSFKWKLTK